MLGKNAWYHNIIKKYIVAFGSLFSDIHVLRTDEAGALVKDIKVPITFASKDKTRYQLNSIHSRINEQVNIAQVLPRISFILNNSIEYDTMRTLNPLLQRKLQIDPTDFSTQEIRIGKPYNFAFQLSIWTKHIDDMFQIIEQVLSFFNPDYFVTIKEIPQLNVETNIPIVYQGCAPTFETEFDQQSWRVLRFDIDFTLKGWIYPPIRDEGIIETIKMNFYNEFDQDAKVAIIQSEYDEEENKVYQALVENYDTDFEDISDGTKVVKDLTKKITLNVYETITEPTLTEDEQAAYWFKLNVNGDIIAKYYIRKSGDSQLAIEI